MSTKSSKHGEFSNISAAVGRHIVLTAGSALMAAGILLGARAQEVKLELMSTGAMQKMGGYMPQRLELSATKPEGLKKAPANLAAPLYGELKMGRQESPTVFYVIIDEPEGKPARLFVDRNGKGEFTDDAAAEWSPRTSKNAQGKELTMYSGGATVKVPYGSETLELHVPMYRFDKTDPQRAAFTNLLFYYSDYARSGSVTLGGRVYPALLVDDAATGDFRGAPDNKRPRPALFLDLNGDGKFERQGESFPVNKPFNIAGTTYEIAGLTASGGALQIVKSAQTVEETKPLPILAAGKRALPFEAATTDNHSVKFPQSYNGKLVMLDFWATWCGPCRAELPHLTAAYEKFHGRGFEVLGISLDQANAAEKLAKFTEENKMPWPQVYDGKYWQAAVAKTYNIRSIPSAFLVDGDTGVIVAAGGQLRGEQLAETLEKALAKKQGK